MSSEGLPVSNIVGVSLSLSARDTPGVSNEASASLSADPRVVQSGYGLKRTGSDNRQGQ
jgi:hypothetical protein